MKPDGFTIELPGFCSHCVNFEAKVDKVEISNLDDPAPRMLNKISCSNINKCMNIAASIKATLSK